ncbi:MAG: hypothetical protein Q4E17_01200 [Synergistes sp.]|nr:hypothetical protein [Synergistes sp.]
MSMDLGSVRLARLNKLMTVFLAYQYIPRNDLMDMVNIVSVRMLQRDISYLKEEFNVNIEYDFKHRAYKCTNPGHFVLNLNFDIFEKAALHIAFDLYEKVMSDTACNIQSAALKLKRFIGEREEVIPDDSNPHSPVSNHIQSYKKILKFLDKMDNKSK